MGASNNAMIPPRLARRISPWIVNGAQMAGVSGKIAFTAIAAFCLYGFGMGIAKSDHNGFVYLFGPWICPAYIALLWSAALARLRFRIYRGSPFAEHDYVTDDPVVARLAAICNSEEARHHLWHETLRLSAILFVLLGTAAFLSRDLLTWTLPSSQNHFLWNRRTGEPGCWFWVSFAGCSWATFMLLSSEYIRWCLMTWAKREVSQQSG